MGWSWAILTLFKAIASPRYVIRSEALSPQKLYSTWSRFIVEHHIGTTLLLLMLILSLVASPKCLIISISVSATSFTGLMKTATSSAYRDSHSRVVPSWRGDMSPSFVALWRIYHNESMARIRRKGDRGPPCLRPLLCLNQSPLLPFCPTADGDDASIRLIQFLHFGGKPLLCNSSSRYSQEMVSNAFVISSLNNRAGTFLRW
jgi:hypothetical protein